MIGRALHDAGADDVVARLPDGWDTVLSGEYNGGTDLSGGQWQRIALARALASVAGGAGVLVLDEPTAALDVRAEAELFDRFLEVTRGVTTLLVSHRLSSVRHADRIVVIDEGRIAEDGSHAELLAAGGRYAAMFTLQASRFAAAGGEYAGLDAAEETPRRGGGPVRHLRAIRLVVSRAVRMSPWQSAVCLLETLGSFVMMLEPLFVTWLVVGAVRHDRSMLVWAVAAFVFSLTVNLFLTIVGNNARITQYERVGFWFDTEVCRLTSSLTTLEHLQNPEYLDRTQVLQDQQGLLGYAFNSVLNLLRNLVLAGGTLVLALVADPRMLLVVLAGVPAVASTRWTTRWQSAMDKETAEPSRRAKHLLGLSLDAGSGAELRVFGAQRWSCAATERTARAWLDLRAANTARQSVLQSACTAFFFVVGTLVLGWLLHDTITGTLGVSQFVLAATLTTRLQEVAGRLQWAANFLVRVSDNGGRYLWLESFARDDADSHAGSLTPPDRLRHGIRTVGLGYTYPGAERPTLEDITLDLPAGAVVALVGENGAGKSTLVGLLTGMLRPTEGRVLVDGVDLVNVDHVRWRARMSGAFQDYARLELTAQQSIGVGDVARVEEPAAARAALDRAECHRRPHLAAARPAHPARHAMGGRRGALRRPVAAARDRSRHDARATASARTRRADRSPRRRHRACTVRPVRGRGPAGGWPRRGHFAGHPTASPPLPPPTWSSCSTRAASPRSAPTSNCTLVAVTTPNCTSFRHAATADRRRHLGREAALSRPHPLLPPPCRDQPADQECRCALGREAALARPHPSLPPPCRDQPGDQECRCALGREAALARRTHRFRHPARGQPADQKCRCSLSDDERRTGECAAGKYRCGREVQILQSPVRIRRTGGAASARLPPIADRDRIRRISGER